MRAMNTLITVFTATLALTLSGAAATAFVDTAACLEAPVTTRSTLACDELLALTDVPAATRAELLRARARILARNGAPDAARADLDAAIAMQPDDVHTWNQRALMALSAGDASSALRDYDEVVRLLLNGAAAPSQEISETSFTLLRFVTGENFGRDRRKWIISFVSHEELPVQGPLSEW